MRRSLIGIGAVLASFLGGIVGSVLLQCNSAWAQNSVLSGSMLTLLGPDGQMRVQAGHYDGSYSQSEKGLPLLCLYDNRHNIRLLLRLAGTNESPVIVFKDTNHQDRMVMGLGMQGSDQDAFIAVIDNLRVPSSLYDLSCK